MWAIFKLFLKFYFLKTDELGDYGRGCSPVQELLNILP